jgi:hypothetical protein
MTNIDFAGIKGEIQSLSPHGNYTVVKLSDRVTICGTISNQFNWEKSPDNDSGFKSFITYIGLKSYSDFHHFAGWITLNNGYFDGDDATPRKAKRVKHPAFPLEIKVRGLIPESVIELVEME